MNSFAVNYDSLRNLYYIKTSSGIATNPYDKKHGQYFTKKQAKDYVIQFIFRGGNKNVNRS